MGSKSLNDEGLTGEVVLYYFALGLEQYPI